jgi:hypothetical protein
MKRRWIWYAHIYYDVIRQLKDKNRVVNSSVLKTTIVGGSKSEAESLPTYKRTMNYLKGKVTTKNDIVKVTKIEFINRLTKTMYEV